MDPLYAHSLVLIGGVLLHLGLYIPGLLLVAALQEEESVRVH